MAKSTTDTMRNFLEERLAILAKEVKDTRRMLSILNKNAFPDVSPETLGITTRQLKLRDLKPKEPKPHKEVSKSGNSRGIRKVQRPEDNFIFQDAMLVDDFLRNAKNIRLYLLKPLQAAVDATGTSDKNIYAIEAGTSKGKRDSITKLAALYGIMLIDLDRKFRSDNSGWYISDDKPWTPKPPKEPKVKKVKEFKEPKKIKTAQDLKDKLRRRVEKQNSIDPADSHFNNGRPVVKKYGERAKGEEVEEASTLPFSLRYRASDPAHGLKAMCTRNYRRIRISVKGVAEIRGWDMDLAMAQMYEELESWLPREKQLDFYSDNERFMSWIYGLAKNMAVSANGAKSKVASIEERMGIAPEKAHADIIEIDEEFKAFMKKNLEYKAGWMKVVFEALVYKGKKIDEAARLASKSMHDADACLKLIKRELIANFGNKYNQLMVW